MSTTAKSSSKPLPKSKVQTQSLIMNVNQADQMLANANIISDAGGKNQIQMKSFLFQESSKYQDTSLNSYQTSQISQASRPKQDLNKNYQTNNRNQNQPANIKQGQKPNITNKSPSPGRIIPMKQIKIVHSPQPSVSNNNISNVSPLLYAKNNKNASPNLTHQPNNKAHLNISFGVQISHFENQDAASVNKSNSQFVTLSSQQSTQHQQLKEKAHQRRRSGYSSRQQSIYEAPQNLNVSKFEEADVLRQDEEEEECHISDENDEKPKSVAPLQTQDKKRISELDEDSNHRFLNQDTSKVNTTANNTPMLQKQTLEEQLRKSLTDFCENTKNNPKRTSRNSKSRNNQGPTMVNDMQTASVQIFQPADLLTELSNQQSLPSTGSIIHSHTPLINDGKSFFLNKVKTNTNKTVNLNANFATQSTTITQSNLNQLDRQTFLFNPTKSFTNQNYNSQMNQLNPAPSHRSNSNNSGTFDQEMKKHGLMNDLKKLDSFNQFIEKHSPQQTRQNSCSYIGDNFGGDGSCDSLRSPYIQQAKFKRAGSGDLVHNNNLTNSNFSLSNFQKLEDTQQDNSKNQTGFQFPFQRRARSNSPPKQVIVQNVIQQKLNECMSPSNKGVLGGNFNGSIIESQISVDQSCQSVIIQNIGKRAGPIKVQQNANFLFGTNNQNNNNNSLGQNDWDFNNFVSGNNNQAALNSLLQSPKYHQLAQAVQMYLNGDYQKILVQEQKDGNESSDELADTSCDPDQMMKHSQDVDEWLLGGASDNSNTFLKSNSQHRLMDQDNEDSIIMKKIEENRIKQQQSNVEKTYIIDDIDEVAPQEQQQLDKYQQQKAYIQDFKDRRVTTVVEQQTWEDMEDDYDESNEQNILKQYEQMRNSSSGDKTLKSFEGSTNNSPDIQIQSSEFKLGSLGVINECQENVIDENEELIKTSDLANYGGNQLESQRSMTNGKMSLSNSQLTSDSCKVRDDDEASCFDDWMYKTFDNSKAFNKVLKSSASSSKLSSTLQQPLQSQVKGSLQQLNNNSRNVQSQMNQHKSQQTLQSSSCQQITTISKVEAPKELIINNNSSKKAGQTFVSRQKQDIPATTSALKNITTKQEQDKNKIQLPRQSPREVKIDLVILQSDQGSAQSKKQQQPAKNDKKPPTSTTSLSGHQPIKRSPTIKNNKENKTGQNPLLYSSVSQNLATKMEIIQQPKQSQPNKFMSKNKQSQSQSCSQQQHDKRTSSQINKKQSEPLPSSQHQSKPQQPHPKQPSPKKTLSSQQLHQQQPPQVLSDKLFSPTQQNQSASNGLATNSLAGSHKRQTSGSGHRHRRTQSTAFDPNFLDQIRNSEFDPSQML
ncbi:UNKNOWN [Stylonychia lemnae]|uniref:Uncharacterized protein n=1 Tax=Stylonychia lemnae TaxID=5949 RepID=A0A077ZS74_STYLE|nr:UNKNOWN [Stylonychia lemnae]|eukprot:CDW72225.1 UNKNOWN [Stylonychia lemnae]